MHESEIVQLRTNALGEVQLYPVSIPYYERKTTDGTQDRGYGHYLFEHHERSDQYGLQGVHDAHFR